MTTNALLNGFKCPRCSYRRSLEDADTAPSVCPSCEEQYPKVASGPPKEGGGGLLFYAIVGLAVLLAAGLGSWKYMQKLERDEYAGDKRRLGDFLSVWAEKDKLAGHTPRIQLSARVADLQEYRRNWASVPMNSKCMGDAKSLLDEAMQSRIDSLIAFMGQEEMVSAIASDNYRNKMQSFGKAVEMCAPKT